MAKTGKFTKFANFVHEGTSVEHGNTNWSFYALNFGVGVGAWTMNDKPLSVSHFCCWGCRNENKFGGRGCGPGDVTLSTNHG